VKLCVYGLWHLGGVTAACMADLGFETVGLDPNETTIADLKKGRPPLFELGLPELVAKGLAGGTLSFSTDPAAAVKGAGIVWVAFDTPVDDEDRADVDYVKRKIIEIFPHLQDGAVVLVSSQMPVGSVAALEKAFAAEARSRRVHFACSPENLRLGKAIEIFRNPGRIVIGIRDTAARTVLEPVLAKICDTLLWISVESAEMTKHAINAFLAACVTYINEVAIVCEEVGADAFEVEKAIRSDPRIGTQTYVTPGAAFAGGTLARDVVFLNQTAGEHGLKIPMLGGIVASNAAHRLWALRRLEQLVQPLQGATVAILGLSYKPGTDAVRRSMAIELCQALQARGIKVRAYDPEVRTLPADLAGHVMLCASPQAALEGADAAVLATEWPQMRELTPDMVVKAMKKPIVLDAARFLRGQLGADDRISYVIVGSQA
jgi:UDPglucose 6-dehydrogenase